MYFIILLLALFLGIPQSNTVGSTEPSLPIIDDLADRELQAAQRDTQYRSDLGRIGAALENYAANNNGSYPQDLQRIVSEGVIDEEDLYLELNEVNYELDGRRYQLSVELPGGDTYELDNF